MTATRAGLCTSGFVLAMLGAAIGGGCVDQTKEVQTYREVLDDHGQKPRPLEADETLTLARALALANADNEQIASQGETYLQALINKNRAVATFLPTVSFQPGFTVEQAPGGSGATASPGAPSPSAATTAASAGGYVQQGNVLRRFEAPVVGSLNLSPASMPNLKGAEMAVVQQRQLLLDARATVLLNVAQTYYQVLISTRQAEVLRDSLALQAARVRDVEGRLKARLALALEVAQARSAEAATRVLLTQAENDVRNGRRVLAVLMGVAKVDGPLVDNAHPPEQLAPVSTYVEQALERRQDLLAAQAALKVAHFAVDAAIAEYYPSVSLNVASFLYRENYANATKWDGILLVNLPLFSPGTIKADVRTAWSRLRQAALFESYLRRQIEQGVQSAYDNFVTSGSQVANLQREVQASSDAYQQSVQLEKNGLAIPLDVLTAQNSLLNAQLELADEVFTRTIFYLDLLRATVGLNPDLNLDVNEPGRAPARALP